MASRFGSGLFQTQLVWFRLQLFPNFSFKVPALNWGNGKLYGFFRAGQPQNEEKLFNFLSHTHTLQIQHEAEKINGANANCLDCVESTYMKNHFLPIALLLCAAPLAAQPDASAKPAKPKVAKTPRVAGTAFIRVLHAIPGGPSVDVYSGTTKIASNLSFKSLSNYMDIKSGKNAIKVVPTGKTEPAIVSEAKTLTKGKFFTLAITGKQAASLLLVNDSIGKEMPDKARVRVVHLAAGAPSVLVTVPSTRGKKGYANFVAKPLAYLESAAKTAKPMTTTVQIRTQDGKIIKEITGVKLEAGKRYDAFALGEVGSSFDVLIKPAATK